MNQYQVYLKNQYSIRQSFDLANKKNNELLQEFQDKCPHPLNNVNYYPDPSGNNDSFHECSLCGFQAKKIITKKIIRKVSEK